VALYVPQARRRRRTLLLAVVTAVVGGTLGVTIGRYTAPDVSDRVRSVRDQARQTASGLEVISLHTGVGAVGAGGTDLVLARTSRELAREFDRAPWVDPGQRRVVLDALVGLTDRQDRDTAAFGDAAGALARMITEVFAGRPPTPAATPGPTPTPSSSAAVSAAPTASASPAGTPTPTG